MACDEEEGIMKSMQRDKEKELLLQQQPHQRQPQVPCAAAPDLGPPLSSADFVEESNSEREIGSHDFLFLFWEAEQQQGRWRVENAKRREVRATASRMEAIGSEKALGLVDPSISSGVGGTRCLVGA